MRPITALRDALLPPVVTQLHECLREWGEHGLSPGPITPDRVWGSIDSQNGAALSFSFDNNTEPRPLAHVGMAQELAAWFVLLDKWVETAVVIGRARAIWSTQELAGALTFTSKPFLPIALLYMPPDNWAQVAAALATAVSNDDPRGKTQANEA